ncbi:MAG: bifunctional folylpolyglutamate synthase/dihydrofolate synthase [Gammaproteobacteria bacterium]|nr:bifunctional folylpolyglutamate synthase/dihydrofolate synthase [Gammaproteobacteria bacterium]MCP5425476.1 bifunctional folylpolyglutamate synthase/dihydrofolate synthase [Gammaproteobacteria bacterium]MCP5459921.1 bifunctional folylpolyglutamate synthase/dihydrofolate synthase [Gammaproteobacteria bacterium]
MNSFPDQAGASAEPPDRITVIANAAQVGDFLNQLIHPDRGRPYRLRPAQVAIRRLLERIGNPQQDLKIIHIAGSKGKGTTALLTEAILTQTGRRVGTFTSPHLQDWRERFRLDGRTVDEPRFVAAFERLRPEVGDLQMRHPDTPLGFFDVATAAALLLFKEAGVDYAIVEAGLGGLLDATNIVQPCVTCITQVDLEHTEQLGHTIAAIARHKAGIIKPGVPVIVGALPPSATQVITDQAARVQAPLVRLNRTVRLRTQIRRDLGTDLWFNGVDLEIHARLPMPGRHLARNAALAIACVQQLGFEPDALRQAIPPALAHARLPGRSEILCRQPWVLVDAAHTRQSVRALADVVNRLPAQRKHLLLGLCQDKRPALLGPALLAAFDSITVTRADSPRAWPPESLADALRSLPASSPAGSSRIRAIADPCLAAQTLHACLTADDLLCVAGSVYLAGALRPLLNRLCAMH